MIPFLIASALLLTASGVWLFRRFVGDRDRLLDIPNERSSHGRPVIRGAGAAIVLTVLGLYVAISGRSVNVSFIAASLSIAIVSFLDDLFRLPLVVRLIVHISAAAGFVYFSGAYGGLAFPGLFELPFKFAGPLLTVIFIVWTTNAYNFMDGIDGIAGMQGAGAGLGWLLFGLVVGSADYASLGAIVMGSCAGFLLFNWQPAKVFMGDVGSTFLGFTFGVFPLIEREIQPAVKLYGFGLAIAFLWLFVFDTVLTRARQIVSGKPFWRPHREHLYQQIVMGYSHASVALYFGFFAIFTSLAIYLLEPWFSLVFSGIGALGLLFWSKKIKIDVKVD